MNNMFPISKTIKSFVFSGGNVMFFNSTYLQKMTSFTSFPSSSVYLENGRVFTICHFLTIKNKLIDVKSRIKSVNEA